MYNTDESASTTSDLPQHAVLKDTLPKEGRHQIEEAEWQKKLQEVITAYGSFVTDIQKLLDNIPNGVLVLSTLKEMANGKVKLIESSIALVLGYDAEKKQFMNNWQDRLKLAGSHLLSSFMSDAQALVEILTLSTGTGTALAADAVRGEAGAMATTELVNLLRKVAEADGAQTVVSLLPDALTKLLPQITDENAKGSLANLILAFQAMLKNEKVQAGATEALQNQGWWKRLQAKISAGVTNADQLQTAVDEVQAEMAQESASADGAGVPVDPAGAAASAS